MLLKPKSHTAITASVIIDDVIFRNLVTTQSGCQYTERPVVSILCCDICTHVTIAEAITSSAKQYARTALRESIVHHPVASLV